MCVQLVRWWYEVQLLDLSVITMRTQRQFQQLDTAQSGVLDAEASKQLVALIALRFVSGCWLCYEDTACSTSELTDSSKARGASAEVTIQLLSPSNHHRAVGSAGWHFTR